MATQFSIRAADTHDFNQVHRALAADTASRCGVLFATDTFERYGGAFKPGVAMRLGADATLVLCEPNAGGRSEVSEALSMEYMHWQFGATDVVTEMQIQYWSSNWKKVDYLCSIRGTRVAVSVTRAMLFKQEMAFGRQEATALLRKKLHGLVVAKVGVCRRHSYDKSVLHIWCQTFAIATAIAACYESVASELGITINVILIATVAATEPSIFINDTRAVMI
ncbi:hypothetical protein DYB32_002737 [Aphanomyces invadans]|uniref:Uncharacterized protein n=1 Tax=Aphanomyces invadans TaxID=157072 RepID=A0A418B2H0_9STRA|nr:hypothetical protein DYB32_002737 [Aphanomyces invadans]